jgi:hypothetical protein
MSVIMQSRGNPLANCIFAKFLHARRGLARRFAANMSVPVPARWGFIRWWISFTEETLELA